MHGTLPWQQLMEVVFIQTLMIFFEDKDFNVQVWSCWLIIFLIKIYQAIDQTVFECKNGLLTSQPRIITLQDAHCNYTRNIQDVSLPAVKTNWCVRG